MSPHRRPSRGASALFSPRGGPAAHTAGVDSSAPNSRRPAPTLEDLVARVTAAGDGCTPPARSRWPTSCSRSSGPCAAPTAACGPSRPACGAERPSLAAARGRCAVDGTRAATDPAGSSVRPMLTRLDLRGADRRPRAAACPGPIPAARDRSPRSRTSWPMSATAATPRSRAHRALRRRAPDALRVPADERRGRRSAIAPADVGRGAHRGARRHRGLPPHPGRRTSPLRARRHPRRRPHRARRPGRLLRARRPGRLPVDGAHDRRSRPRWPGSPRSCCASRPTPHGPGRRRRRSPPPRSPGSTRSTPIGGAQAIAAMAYGTESIAPGRRHRRARATSTWPLAKREVAGPGRRAVGVRRAVGGRGRRRRHGAPADFAAIDVIVQAEHGPDGLAWLVTWDEAVADAVDAAIGSPRGRRAPPGRHRRHVRRRAGTAPWSTARQAALAVANPIAPEHLELMTDDPDALVPLGPPRRCRVLRAAGAGLGRRLRRRAQPRPPHRRHAPGSPAPSPSTTSQAGPRGPRRRRRVAPGRAAWSSAIAAAEGLAAHAESVRLRRRALDAQVSEAGS